MPMRSAWSAILPTTAGAPPMKRPATDHLHIITGGPGSGKTSLIEALAAQGLSHKPESGRAIIREQVAIGGTALPWADRAAFAAAMLRRDSRAWRSAVAAPGPILFDRGIPDVLGYLALCELPIPPLMWRAAERRRYARTIFIAPPWPAIFAQDAERRQTAVEAEATFDAMVGIYTRLGYDLVELPRASVADRARFIRARIR